MDSKKQQNLAETDLELNLQLLSSIQLLENKLRVAGSPVSQFSENALNKLRSLSTDRKKELTDLYTHLNSSIDPTMPEQEIPFLQTALKKMGYSTDPTFWKKFEQNDVLEIYGPNMKQVYRNLNFYKVSPYSLLDLSTFEWPELYERSEDIAKMAFEKASRFSTQQLPCGWLDIPEHIVTHSLVSGYTLNFKPTSCVVQLKYISTLMDMNFNLPSGFLVSSTVKVLDRSNLRQIRTNH